jgi:hypothetical protein
MGMALHGMAWPFALCGCVLGQGALQEACWQYGAGPWNCCSEVSHTIRWEMHVLTAAVLFARAGFVSAGLFRSSRGPKAAVIAGAVGSLAAAGLAGARQYFPSL